MRVGGTNRDGDVLTEMSARLPCTLPRLFAAGNETRVSAARGVDDTRAIAVVLLPDDVRDDVLVGVALGDAARSANRRAYHTIREHDMLLVVNQITSGSSLALNAASRSGHRSNHNLTIQPVKRDYAETLRKPVNLLSSLSNLRVCIYQQQCDGVLSRL
jgi:hypothetical protein